MDYEYDINEIEKKLSDKLQKQYEIEKANFIKNLNTIIQQNVDEKMKQYDQLKENVINKLNEELKVSVNFWLKFFYDLFMTFFQFWRARADDRERDLDEQKKNYLVC